MEANRVRDSAGRTKRAALSVHSKIAERVADDEALVALEEVYEELLQAKEIEHSCEERDQLFQKLNIAKETVFGGPIAVAVRKAAYVAASAAAGIERIASKIPEASQEEILALTEEARLLNEELDLAISAHQQGAIVSPEIDVLARRAQAKAQAAVSAALTVAVRSSWKQPKDTRMCCVI